MREIRLYGSEGGEAFNPRSLPLSLNATLRIWQKESFDHIVRSPDSLEKIRVYIRGHQTDRSGSGVPPLL